MELISIALLAVSCVAIVLSLIGLVRANKSSAELIRMQQQISQTQQSISHLQDELNELSTGAIGVGKRVRTMQLEISSLQEELKKMAEMDGDSKVYANAIRLVKSGADAQAIMQECDLPLPEVDMLIQLHRSST